MKKPFRYALVTGKFDPLHIGHESLLDFAMSMCDVLIVQISDDPERNFLPYEKKEDSIRNLMSDGDDNILIHRLVDTKYLGCAKDESGTVTDQEYWDWYIAETKKFLDSINLKRTRQLCVISADPYGGLIAEKLNCTWVPFEKPARLRFASSTVIRASFKEPLNYNESSTFSSLSGDAAVHLAKVVCIVGPESSGKSTIISSIRHNYYGYTTVNEYGRFIDVAKKGKLTTKDFDAIVHAQQYLIDQAMRNSDCGLVVVDTDAITTNIYSKYMLDKVSHTAFEMMEKQEKIIDLWVLLPPDLPFDDDGTRTMKDEEEREKVYDELKSYLEVSGLNHVAIERGLTGKTRFNHVMEKIHEFFRSDKYERPFKNIY